MSDCPVDSATNPVNQAADIMISAQLRLEDFYTDLGFGSEGWPYIEDGIDHVEMRMKATRSSQSTTLREKQR